MHAKTNFGHEATGDGRRTRIGMRFAAAALLACSGRAHAGDICFDQWSIDYPGEEVRPGRRGEHRTPHVLLEQTEIHCPLSHVHLHNTSTSTSMPTRV